MTDIFLSVLTLLPLLSTGRHLHDNRIDQDLWLPETGTREDFFRCNGLPCEQQARVIDKLYMLEHTLKEENGISWDLGPPKDGCIIYTEDQVDYLLNRAKLHNFQDHKNNRRQKRKLHNFMKEPDRKWHNSIAFMFDGTHNDEEKIKIRSAFDKWEHNTCLNFEELNKIKEEKIKDSYILLTKETYGCYSFVGKTGTKAQIINLSSHCFQKPGIALHETGHALGLWHEHQRRDRDNWITIHYDNIGRFISQFYTQDTKFHGVPYDYTSVMHYPQNAGSINGFPTITARDPLYTKSMGQRLDLSFLDKKLINFAYCNDSCKNGPKLECKNGGYPNPSNCSQCLCPDGFSHCTSERENLKGTCGDVIKFDGIAPRIITSPRYGEAYYDLGVECSWHIKAPLNHTILMLFVGDFGVFGDSQLCHDWVELKYKYNFDHPGHRFCGQTAPENLVESSGNEAIVIFKTNVFVAENISRRGFKLLIWTENNYFL